ncbi:hypothetical protein HDU92_001574 [Lobulomyces angularis]|nr:hypothetical protein HDU92_001574 [Lobulomyces angularis]
MYSEFGMLFAEPVCYNGRKLPFTFFLACGDLTLEKYESLENNCTAGSIATTCYLCGERYIIFNCRMEFNATLAFPSFMGGYAKYIEHENLNEVPEKMKKNKVPSTSSTRKKTVINVPFTNASGDSIAMGNYTNHHSSTHNDCSSNHHQTHSSSNDYSHSSFDHHSSFNDFSCSNGSF